MRVGWRDVWDADKVNVIEIATEPNNHYMHQSTLQFVSHVGLTLDAISHGISGGERWSVDDVQSKLAAAFKEPDEWGPGTVIDICREVLPRDTVATVDAGAHRILLS
jgi:acetolactate synthase I/II/III large subunit